MRALLPAIVGLLGALQLAQAPRTEPLTGSNSEEPLFRGADRYAFSIIIPAGDMECFWQFAHQNGQFYFSYQVQWTSGIGQDRRILATANDPNEVNLGTSVDVRGHMNILTKETGFYQLCVGNRYNHFGSTQVYLNFGVYYEGSELQGTPKPKGKEFNETIEAIQASTVTLTLHLFLMWRYYSASRMRSTSDIALLMFNYNYLNWWSAIQSIAIILSGLLQVYALKRLFAARPTEKPRC